jgi:pyruvate kinase
MRRTKVWCTLGPASLHAETIGKLDSRAVDLLRINLSHTPIDTLERTITLIRSNSSIPICIDTEGAQVRCGVMGTDVLLAKGTKLLLTAEAVQGTRSEISLTPRSAFERLRPGHTVAIDWDGALVEVTSTKGESAEAIVLEEGLVRSNKGAHIEPSPPLPPLTPKDYEAIEIGIRHGIRNFALSFASGAADVAILREAAGAGAYIMAKLESGPAIRDMDRIIDEADAVVIDRGDLSRSVPVEFIPQYQKEIIRRANSANKPAFVATNLLESMVNNRNPTIAEANDIINTLIDGAHGLVLAAETAIGLHPVASVDMVLRLIEAFEWSNRRRLREEDAVEAVLDLPDDASLMTKS